MKSLYNIPDKMKALVLHAVNDLRYDEVDNYKLEKEYVLVKIEYCGICSSDIERVFINGTYHFPTIPGHEMAGKIVSVNDEDEDLLGRRVCIFPLLPCRECNSCKRGEYAQCSNYNYFGSRCDGGFSEYLLVPKWNLVLFDDSIDYKIACLCEPTAVSLHALNIANIKSGDNVAISGTGTIAILIGFLAKDRGADVTIVGRNAKKLNKIKEFGFEILNINDIGGITFDKVFEVVGSNSSINQAIDLADAFGTVVLIGNPKDDVVLNKNVYWKILRKQLIVTGSWNSSYNDKVNDWVEVIRLMEKNSIPFEKLITKEFVMSNAEEAFKFVMNNASEKFKVVLKND